MVAKIFVNRMKPILSSLISKEQGAFVPRCSIVENILIGQEVMHSLICVPPTRCLMTVKLDMKKANDHIHWPFLFNMLKYFGFHGYFIG